MENNKNLFRESVVFGNFVNCDDIKTGGNQANAKFKRNVLIGGDLTLGLETSTTTNGVTAYTDTGGNIIVKKNGITYTLTPTILSYLSTINDNIQDQIDNITTPDLSSYAPKNNPEFTGTALAPTPITTDDSRKIATTAFVKAQGYLTTSPDLSSYAPKNNPTFTGTAFAPTPSSIYDDSTKIATTEWAQNLIDIYSLTAGTKISQYIIAYANTYLSFKLTPTSNILGKNYYTYNPFTPEVSFGEYFVSNPGATGIISGYGWNDGIWKASTEGRYYVEVKLDIEYDRFFVGGGSNQNLDNQFVLYVKDVNNTTISSKTIYSRVSTQYTDSINYKTGIFIPLNGYFTILKEGNKDVYINWGYDTYTTGNIFASIRVTQITNSPDLSSYAPKNNPEFTGTALAPTPTSDKNNTEIATTAFVKAQLSINSIYCELGGNYLPVDIVATPSLADLTFIENTNDAIYSSVNAIVGYSSIAMTSTGAGQGSRYFTFGNFRNYTTNGYDTSLYGFNTLNGNWKCPQTGNYSICINFYIKSNNGGNKFSLNKYNSSNTLIYSQYCLVGDTITTDTIRNFTTILPMNKDEYFKIVLTTYVGNTTMVFNGTDYTNMRIMLLAV